MTLKEILEDGYGIDFESLDFTTRDGSTKEEILKSMSENEIKVESRGVLCPPDDYDIFEKETVIYL